LVHFVRKSSFSKHPILGKTGEYVFNGLIKRGMTNYTQWQNKAPLTYLDWGPSEPSAFGSEHCGLFL